MIYTTSIDSSALRRLARSETLLILNLNVEVTNQNVEDLTRVDLTINIQRSKTVPNMLDLDFGKTIIVKINNSQNSVSVEESR